MLRLLGAKGFRRRPAMSQRFSIFATWCGGIAGDNRWDNAAIVGSEGFQTEARNVPAIFDFRNVVRWNSWGQSMGQCCDCWERRVSDGGPQCPSDFRFSQRGAVE